MKQDRSLSLPRQRTPRSISFHTESGSDLHASASGSLFKQQSLTRYSSMGVNTENESEFDMVANQMILSSSSEGGGETMEEQENESLETDLDSEGSDG